MATKATEDQVAKVAYYLNEHGLRCGCPVGWLAQVIADGVVGVTGGCTCSVPCATAHDCSQTPQAVWVDVTAVRPT